MNDKQSLIQELNNTHQRITSLVTTLSDDELAMPYHPGVNPPLWEIGHAAFFFEVFILKELDHVESLNPKMDDIWDSFHIDHKDRWKPGIIPSRQDTLDYVNEVYRRILARIEAKPLSQDELYLYKYAIFHQNMHIESLIWARQTMAYPKIDFGRNEEVSKVAGAETGSSSNELGDAEIPGGWYHIGMPGESEHFATEDFAFDNEKPGFDKEIESFRISRTLVSNEEFLAFVEAGGYENKDYWSWGGRKWLCTEQSYAVPPDTRLQLPRHPLYWKQEDGVWYERLFNEWRPLVGHYPVTHISYFEAEAYCNWAGRRLPTEYEWEVAALGNRKGEKTRKFPWGDTMDASRVDMDAVHMAQVSVTDYPEGESPFGCRQMLGTVWEWTSSQYLPYAGFTHDMYPFMSTLQFGYHKTTRGGSCATSSILIRGSYRQAYLPERADVFVGFRTCAL